MISPDDALACVLEQARPLSETESVPIEQACGRVLAQDVRADRDSPPFDRVCMDGYAGLHVTIPVGRTLPVRLEVRAGYGSEQQVAPGELARVMTGAPLPAGTDTVIPVESTREEEDGVQVLKLPERFGNVARAGSEGRQDDLLLAAGTVLRPIGIAVLAAVGRTRVPVVRQPELAIVATGDEIVDPATVPGPYQIRDSNSFSLFSQASLAGFHKISRYHATDDVEALDRVLRRALKVDVAIISGGVSRGRYDLVPEVLSGLGVTRHFHEVAQQPARPFWFGSTAGCLVFGAPGNPLATVLTFDRYVLPALRSLAGLSTRRARFDGCLTQPVRTRPGERELFVFAEARVCPTTRYDLEPLARRGAADTFSTARANAIFRMSPGTRLDEGAEVQFTMIGVFEGAF